jgi:biotin carboxyl carrier protein
MEAMKMENEIQSNIEGGIKEIRCKEGDSVNEGDVLVVLE